MEIFMTLIISLYDVEK